MFVDSVMPSSPQMFCSAAGVVQVSYEEPIISGMTSNAG